MQATSLEAYKDIQVDGKPESQCRVILASLERGPMTAREIGANTGLGNHVVTKRRGYLLRCGVVGEARPRKCSITGRKAHPLVLTDEGRLVLEGNDFPRPGPSLGERREAVLRAAKTVADLYRGAVPPRELQALIDAVWEYQHHKDQRRAGKTVEREPWGSPRRRRRAKEGVWVRKNGDEVAIRDMTPYHLRGAIQWCERNECPLDAEPLAALLLEYGRRVLPA